MKVKGICADCQHRWQYGDKGNPQHLWCCKRGAAVKNTKMKSCEDYSPATPDALRAMRSRGCGGLGK